MCNYGHPKHVPPGNMYIAVQKALETLTISPSTLWVGAYNMFDEREVPAPMRRRIFELLGQSGADLVITETHPDSVSESSVRECVNILGKARLAIEIGIESTNSFVRRWCINKDFDHARIVSCVEHIHRGGALCYANYLLGAPFLSTAEAVQDVLASIVDSAAIGIDYFVVLPNHVKPYTLVGWLYTHKLYSPPSLWALVETLQQLTNDLRPRVRTSWVISEDVPGKSHNEIPPQFEDDNSDALLSDLIEYSATESAEALRRLFEYASPARTSWREMSRQTVGPLLERIVEVFPKIGREVLGCEWWNAYGEQVLLSVRTTWNRDAGWLRNANGGGFAQGCL
jgi:radical SAM enzyme (TIGR01210 family)